LIASILEEITSSDFFSVLISSLITFGATFVSVLTYSFSYFCSGFFASSIGTTT